jgi:glycerophosphoryl diester phosphodiesterase
MHPLSNLVHSVRCGLRALAIAVVFLPLGAPAFDLQGHRGTRGNEPENTIAGFERALQIGVTTLEMDAGVTADGTVVVYHDRALNPFITRDKSGQWLRRQDKLIKHLSYEEIKLFDVGRIDKSTEYGRQFPNQEARDGQRIPRLADVFARVNELGADHVRFDIETKIDPNHPDQTLPPEEFVTALLKVVRDAGMTRRVVIQSFDWRTLQLVQKVEPAIETMYLTSRSRTRDTLEGGTWTAGMLLKDYESAPHMVKASGGSIWAPAFQNLTAEGVKAAQKLGLKVIPWTVNELKDAEQLIDWGVDGIISDYPDRIRGVLQRRGIALPAAVGPK